MAKGKKAAKQTTGAKETKPARPDQIGRVKHPQQDAETMRAKGFVLRRYRTHAAIPPQRK